MRKFQAAEEKMRQRTVSCRNQASGIKYHGEDHKQQLPYATWTNLGFMQAVLSKSIETHSVSRYAKNIIQQEA